MEDKVYTKRERERERESVIWAGASFKFVPLEILKTSRPDNFNFSVLSRAIPLSGAQMGRHPSERTPANAGKGKVTPTQIAFIVDRYLAESGYTSTLASFRSECQLHSSATRTKDLPKGLLSLAEILDDYVTLKGQRIVLDQEKQRVETLIRGMQDVVQTYHSSGTDDLSSLAFPSTPLPLQPSEASAFPLASARPSPGN